MTASNSTGHGVVVISIDVAPPQTGQSLEVVSQIDQVAGDLLTQLNAWQLPATWAVAEPLSWGLTKEIRNSRMPHEVSLLADASWIGGNATRALLAQELGRRLLAGRAAGLPLTSVVPYDTAFDDHLDLLIKHEVRAVRGLVDSDARAASPAQPHPLHYGLWEVPGSMTLPARCRWLPGGGGVWKARRRIDRAGAAGLVFYLVIDVATLVEAGAGAEKIVRKVFAHVASRRSDRQVAVVTLSEVAAHLNPTRQKVTSRSVLRAAG